MGSQVFDPPRRRRRRRSRRHDSIEIPHVVPGKGLGVADGVPRSFNRLLEKEDRQRPKRVLSFHYAKSSRSGIDQPWLHSETFGSATIVASQDSSRFWRTRALRVGRK